MKQFDNLRTFAFAAAVVASAFTTMAREDTGSLFSNARYSPFVHDKGFVHHRVSTPQALRNGEMPNGISTARSSTAHRRVVNTSLFATTRSGVAPISISPSPYRGSELPGVAATAARPLSAYLIRPNELGERILDTRISFAYDVSGRLSGSNDLTGSGAPLFVDANLDPIGSFADYEWASGERSVVVYHADGSYTTTYYWGSDPNPTSRFVEAYDAAGRTTLFEEWEWDSGQEQLVCLSREINRYDEQGNRLLRERYDGSVGQYKEEATYDANGNILSEIEYRWSNSRGRFVYNFSYEYTYDAVGYPLSYLKKKWSGSPSVSQSTERSTCLFDSQTKTLTAPLEVYNTTLSQWELKSTATIVYLNSPQTPLVSKTPTDSTVFAYDAANRVTSSKYYEKKNNVWTLTDEEETVYDAAGLTTDNWYKYLESDGITIKGKRTQSIYTAAGYLQLETQTWWDGSIWRTDRKDAYTYDTADRCTSYTKDYWADAFNAYVPEYKETRSYDSNGRILVEADYQKKEDGRLVENSLYKYIYEAPTVVGEAADAQGCVYALSGAIVIEGVEAVAPCAVYTVDGRAVEVRSIDALSTGRLVISVPQGLYVVRTANASYKVVVP